jgi:2-polyprenyl-6-methoxyphenol hydroxylase-like FAD-dependent oxidoreductase
VEEVPVLVIGAGPVGLALAVVLDHHGVRCRIIDRSDTPGQLSKAGGIQARTLEILDELRLSEPFLEHGMRMTASEVRSHGTVIAGFGPELATGSRYPFVLGLPQSSTEAILTERLRARGVEVERGVELGECRQDDFGVTTVLRHRDGSSEIVRTRWIAGCDGPHSTVREALRIPFPGDDARTHYALGDVELAWVQAADTAMLLLQDQGGMQLHPIGPDRWRVAVDCGPLHAPGRPAPPTPQDLQELCDAYLPSPTRVGTVHWSTYYCVHHRRAFRLRARRAFLLGDAAHVHSPITFQGMNAGIQDAWNLGWKLAMAERGTATELLLDSYDAERREVDARITRDTGQVERLFTGRDLLTDRARDVLFPFVAALPGYERHMGRRTSQLSYGYRASPAVGGRPSPRLHPGDLAPDPPFTTDSGVRIRDGRSYVSLLFTGDPQSDAELSPIVDMTLPGTVPIRPVLITKVSGLRSNRSGTSIVNDIGGGIHQAWGITRPTHVLVRPDGYIGWRADPPDAEAVTRFLTTLHGALPPDRPPAPNAARSERLNG